MNWKQTLFWMGVTALALALFWHIWNLITGEIPAVRELVMSFNSETEESNIVWTLPFAISHSSHSWSVLVAPLFVLLFSWFLSRTEEVKVKKNKDSSVGLILALILGLICGLLGLIAGLNVGLFFALGSGLGIGLILGLIVGLQKDQLNTGLYFSGGYGLGFGFVCGWGWTMPLGMLFGAVVALPTALILIVLTVLILGIKETFQSLFGEKSPPSEQSEQNKTEDETSLAKTQPSNC